MIIDTIGCSYDSMEELIERQHVIEDRIKDYIEEKGIANRYESLVSMSRDNRFYLTVKIIQD